MTGEVDRTEESTTVRVKRSTIDLLNAQKIHPRETLEDVILRVTRLGTKHRRS